MRAAPAIVCFAAALLALGGCKIDWVREHPLGCRADEQMALRDTLYFGLSIPGGGNVDADAWRRFESEMLTPAFPRGYSVLDATGHWRGNDGMVVSESSRVVVIVHGEDAASETALRRIVARYREMFRQESVLRERAAVCATF